MDAHISQQGRVHTGDVTKFHEIPGDYFQENTFPEYQDAIDRIVDAEDFSEALRANAQAQLAALGDPSEDQTV